jgi:Deoxycytidylate deaminase
MNNLTRESINVVYRQYEHFTIIGLTGRCGSGCSTTKNALSSKDFKPRELLKDQKNNNSRDLSVLVNYALQKKIFPFTVLKVRDVLTTYALDDIEAFFEIVKAQYGVAGVEDKFDKHMKRVFQKENYEDICAKSKELWAKMEEDIHDFITNMDIEKYNFIFTKLGLVGDAIRDFLQGIHKDAYTIVYQHIGNLVRTYGCLPFKVAEAKQSAEYLHSVVKRINYLLKLLRRKEWVFKGDRSIPVYKSDVRVVIDSIKNNFEANYLRARYHSFYLIALTLDDSERRKRIMAEKELDTHEMDIIDLREQPARARIEFNKKDSLYKKFLGDNPYNNILVQSYEKGSHVFNLQDVDSCIQNADILINNKGSVEDLKRNLLRYTCLMMHPGLVLPTDDERCMQVAQSAKVNSGCISRQVGAVVSNKAGSILSLGWNDPATSNGNECVSCIRRDFTKLCKKEDEDAYSFFEFYDLDYRKHLKTIMLMLLERNGCDIKSIKEKTEKEVVSSFKKFFVDKLDGLPFAYCFKDIYNSLIGEKNQVHTRAQHGEEKAFEGCTKSDTAGGTLYTTSSSCELCAKKALSYGISRIVYVEPYSGITNDHILGHKVAHGGNDNMHRDSEGNEIPRKEAMKIELFTGATQSAYVQLYTPLFPLKDEMELRGVRIK